MIQDPRTKEKMQMNNKRQTKRCNRKL